jgi:hypothetical protein
VSEKVFPSGPWVGFYTYSGTHDKHRMDLGLTFASGRISGGGNDDIGPFIIAGRFDAANGECHWTKTYVGAHDVFYCGFRESKGIWGTWEILSDIRGGFHIWPRAHAEGEKEAASAEVSVPAFEVCARHTNIGECAFIWTVATPTPTVKVKERPGNPGHRDHSSLR